MQTALARFSGILILLLGLSASASAQTYSVLMEKLNQIENRITSIETSRQKDLKRVERQLAATQTPAPDLSHQLNAIQDRLNRLEAEDAQPALQPAAQTVPAEDVTLLVADIRDLLKGIRQTSEEKSATTAAKPVSPATTPSDVLPAGKVSGYMFADYYVLAQASGNKIAAVSGATSKKNNGFAFRRIYLQYDRKITPNLSTRLRFEAKDVGFGKGESMSPSVKHAYLKYSSGKHTAYTGLIGTPTWSLSEKAWGYRSVEKTIMDLHKVGSSADLGFSYQGKLDSKGKVRVHAMFGNGSGTKPESDNHKKIYLQTAIQPAKSLTLAGYADYESQSGGANAKTLAGFLGLKRSNFQGGLEGFWRINHANGANEAVRGVSAFGTATVSNNAKVYARLDAYDPSNQKTDDREYLFISGIDYSPASGVHLMPNIWMQAYEEAGVQTDIVPRMTFYYKF